MEAKRTVDERSNVLDDGDDAGRRQSGSTRANEAVFHNSATNEP